MTSLVLDFDGTMCHLFRNFDLKQTAVLLQKTMSRFGVVFCAKQDVFDVFAAIAAQVPDVDAKRTAYLAADAVISEAEDLAVKTCVPIPGVEDFFLRLAPANKYNIGIATNNSARCVRSFLTRIGCSAPVVGRVPDNPERLKPDPWSLSEVLALLNAPSSDSIFVGDSANDRVCCDKCGCTFVGMASTAKKKERLLKLVPSSMLVSDFYELNDKLNAILHSS